MMSPGTRTFGKEVPSDEVAVHDAAPPEARDKLASPAMGGTAEIDEKRYKKRVADNSMAVSTHSAHRRPILQILPSNT